MQMRIIVNRYVQMTFSRRHRVFGNVNAQTSKMTDFGAKVLAACLLLFHWALAASAADEAQVDSLPHAGPLVDSLTLAPGHRIEAAGPFFYDEQREGKRTWAVPPLFSYTRDEDTDSEEFDLGYPILTYDRYGGQYRWQFFQLLSLAGGPSQKETARNRFSIFPFYLQQRSSDPSQNYTSVIPFYGHLKNRLFRDEVYFIMMLIFV